MDASKLKTGDKFISFEEFILLPESFFPADKGRIWGVSMKGDEWMRRYAIAKESWEKYGTTPPLGRKVAVLVNGHGTSFPTISDLRNPKDFQDYLPKRILSNEQDDTFFILEGEDRRYRHPYAGQSIMSRSLVDKNLWWRSIYILD